MSILTKVFALLVSVLSIFLCGVMVVFVANTANYRAEADRLRAQVTAATTDAANSRKALDDVITRRDATHQILNSNYRTLEMQYDEMMRSMTVESQRRQQAESERTIAINLSRSLRETIDDMYATQNQIHAALNAAHEQMLTAQAQVVALRREVDGQRNRADQESTVRRQHEEKIYALEQSIEQLRSRLQQVSLASREMTYQADQVSQTSVAASGVPIRGQITEVRDDLASISVGSSSGVQQDMMFKVYRDNQYLGDLKVIYVEATESAGRLVLAQGDVFKGDAVTTGFN